MSDPAIRRDDRFEIGAVFRLQYEPVQQACSAGRGKE